MLDFGTDNEALLNDPFYLRNHRLFIYKGDTSTHAQGTGSESASLFFYIYII